MGSAPRRIAFFAFDYLTLLDLVGVYDGLRRVASMAVDTDVSHRIIGTAPQLHDDTGFVLQPHGVYEDLSQFDLLIVPGGYGTHRLEQDERCLRWLESWGKEKPIASVCTGSVLLGFSGHLKGLRATTHHTALTQLRPHCAEVVSHQRIVDTGRVVTAAGVSASIDLGLYLVEKYWGEAARLKIAAQMEYRAYSPT